MDDTVVGVKFWPYGRLGKVFRGNNKQTNEQLRKEAEKMLKCTDLRTVEHRLRSATLNVTAWKPLGVISQVLRRRPEKHCRTDPLKRATHNFTKIPTEVAFNLTGRLLLIARVACNVRSHMDKRM